MRQQLISSLIVTILYAIWAGVASLKHPSTAGLTVLFTLSQLVLNASPNATTWLIPTEVFPTRVRGTTDGLSAASGKCGAVLTAFAFGTITDKIGLKGVSGLFSGIMAMVAILTLLIPETKGAILDDIENETPFGGKAMESQSSSLESSRDVIAMEKSGLKASKRVSFKLGWVFGRWKDRGDDSDVCEHFARRKLDYFWINILFHHQDTRTSDLIACLLVQSGHPPYLAVAAMFRMYCGGIATTPLR